MNIQDFLLNGLGQPDTALLLNRLAVGAFFAISGYHKLFNKERHATLVATLKACGVPFLGFNQWFVPSVEFFGGLGVVSGVLAPLAALGMLCILGIAILTDGMKRVNSYTPINRADYVCDVLYLPETIYAVMLAVVVIAGPGQYGLQSIALTLWNAS